MIHKEDKFSRFLVTWLNDLARWIFDKQLTTVQMCDSHLESTQSLNQADALDDVEVIAFTAEVLDSNKQQKAGLTL